MYIQSKVGVGGSPNLSSSHKAASPQKNGRSPKWSTCFGCHKPGHWIGNCPDKSPSKPNQAVSITSDSEFPFPLRCRCGFGHCFLRTSHSATNPNRKYYACPGTTKRNCRMFKWCDKVTMDEFNNPPQYRFPECNCGAGTCNLVLRRSGPNAGQNCFVCYVEQGYGACSFSQLFDAQRHTVVNGQAESKSFRSPPSTPENRSNTDLVEDGDVSSRRSEKRDFEATMVDNPRHSPSLVAISGHSKRNKVLLSEGRGHDEKSAMPSPKPYDSLRDCFVANASSIPDSTRDLAISQDNLCGSTIKNTLKASLLTSQAGICCRQIEFQRQISSAGATSFEVIPPHCPAEVEQVDTLLQSTPVQDAQNAAGVLRDSGIERANLFMEKISDILRQSALSVQNDLLNLLESMDLHDHEGMLRAAEKAFDVLNDLKLDYTTFRERVVEYIGCASSLALIEWSMCDDLSTRELVNRYHHEKEHFDSLSCSHANAMAAFTASKESLQSLDKEASSLKNKLFQIEKQLSACKAENMDLESRLVEISEEVSMSQQNVQAASMEAEKASKLHEQREAERSTAKVALDKAKLQLWQ